MDKKEFYTKLIYEHKCIEDFGPTVVEQKITAWDLDATQMTEMFHTLMIGAGFTEETFCSGLISWLEENHPEKIDEIRE